jgi:hypothetical protein
MKDKYIEEDFPRYFVFGEHENGTVDLATPSNDTIATVSKEHADNIIGDRDAIVSKLCAMARAFDESDPDAFTRFWYGK